MHKPNVINDDIIYDVIMTLQGDYSQGIYPARVENKNLRDSNLSVK